MKKRYTVNPEFIDKWGGESDQEFTMEDVNGLADEWGMTVDELMEQVDEI